MSRFKSSKTWLVLALYALIGVMGGPLLSASCCCASEAKILGQTSGSAVGLSCHQAPPAAVPKPSCHNSGAGAKQCDQAVSSVTQNTQQASSQIDSSSRPHSEPSLGRQCLCHAADQSMFLEQAKPSTKAPVFARLALPVLPFAPVIAPVIERWSIAPANLLFSKFFFVSLLGRAPPAI